MRFGYEHPKTWKLTERSLSKGHKQLCSNKSHSKEVSNEQTLSLWNTEEKKKGKEGLKTIWEKKYES